MTAPPATGARTPFAALPDALRRRVAAHCGGRIVRAQDASAGFSPGVAALVQGPAVACFAKAVSVDANPETPGIHRREAEVLAALDGSGVRAPRLLEVSEDDGWVLLVTDALPGANPPLPWRGPDVEVLVATLDDLHRAGPPGPVPALAPVADGLRETLDGWRTLAGRPSAALGGLPAWVGERLDALADVEATWAAAAEGDSLLHIDARGDNLLIHRDQGTLVDWPWAARGHPLLDLVAAAPAVAMQGGPAPADLLALSPTGRAAERDRLLPLVAAVVGMFVERSRRPDPPGLPTLRAFQAAQAEAGLPWLRTLLG